MLVGRTAGSIARTFFLRVTVAIAGAADRTVGGKATFTGTTVFVAGVALSVAAEFAGRAIAAAIVATAVRTTAVTVLAALDDAVATLASHDGVDILVVREAINLSIQAQSCANIADAAWREPIMAV